MTAPLIVQQQSINKCYFKSLQLNLINFIKHRYDYQWTYCFYNKSHFKTSQWTYN